MDNSVNYENAQLSYLEEKDKLMRKLKIFCICLAVFFVVVWLMDREASIFTVVRQAFYLTLVMYLPFKICYEGTGSIISSLIGSFILVLIVGLVLGDSSTLLGWVLLGGMALDFGWSIYRMRALKKMLPEAAN